MKRQILLSAIATLSLSLAVIGWMVLAPGPQAADGDSSDQNGKEIFLAQKCNLCHSVTSAGIESKMKSGKMKGPDLTGITSRQETDWIAKFVRKKVQKDGKDHQKGFKGSDDDLEALISWLGQQTQPVEK